MSDVCEEASKVAKIRAEKAEDEVAELAAKSRQLETELDLTTERLGIVSLQLEEKEKSLLAAEAEMNALNRRVQGLEEDLEKTEEKLVAANTKLDKAGTAADDSERAKKVFENKAVDDDKRIAGLEKELKRPETKLKQQMQLMKKFLRNLCNVIQILKRLKKEQKLQINLFRSCKRRLTGLRMNLLLSKRSSKQSLRSWNKPLLKCLDINNSKQSLRSWNK